MSRAGPIAFVLALAGLAVVGCPRRITLPDSGPEEDAERPDTPIYRDYDEDGLCDGTESTLGLDPTRADTDADGYPDVLEYSVGTDGRMLDSPVRDNVVFLSGVRGSVIDASVQFSVRGAGETFIGGFSPTLSFIPDPEGRDAFRYFAGARAIGATPMENVFSFEGERFLGVRNRVLLIYSMTFMNGDEEPDCMRIFPFVYQLQTVHDGRVYGQRRLWLVVTPPDMSPGRGAWCPVQAEGLCR